MKTMDAEDADLEGEGTAILWPTSLRVWLTSFRAVSHSLGYVELLLAT